GRAVGRSFARRGADPDVAIGEALRLPDRGARLGLVDRVPRGVERRAAMRGDRHDGDRWLAERDLADAMHDREATHAETLRDLVRDLAQYAKGHRLVGLVFERIHGPPCVACRLVL